ncbi:OLC1v1033910C1 [Oldenlandia corymbosa var. corymbosa]|uniref:OLC1v1033910C1 n=1 Tax=Oldenlandia corymbosa var. corymbosa TaxID=529605 RepID=A0AAV1CQ22_OLDCO|nr:OLC1v1033910C1 [Oldenlandia corymbosa var. corymbosa]
MCAIAVVRPQDHLRQPNGSRRSPANSIPNNVFSFRSNRRKRSPTRVESTGQDRFRSSNSNRKSPDSSPSPSPPKSNLVMGQVKILKRGEALPDSMIDGKKPVPPPAPRATPAKEIKKLGFAARRNDDELVLCSTGRLGPDPKTVQMQIRASDFYAGPAPIVASPPPSSLPLPAFFRKEKMKIDAATNDLLRLLRLDIS